jgi:hypothetical protein
MQTELQKHGIREDTNLLEAIAHGSIIGQTTILVLALIYGNIRALRKLTPNGT